VERLPQHAAAFSSFSSMQEPSAASKAFRLFVLKLY
jgi:hypothetical protein